MIVTIGKAIIGPIYQFFLHACYTSIKLSINLIKLTDNKGFLQARLKNKIQMVKIKQIIQKALSITSHTYRLFSTIHKNDQFRDKIGEFSIIVKTMIK